MFLQNVKCNWEVKLAWYAKDCPKKYDAYAKWKESPKEGIFLLKADGNSVTVDDISRARLPSYRYLGLLRALLEG